MNNDVKEKLKNPKQHIPIGMYCYDENGICPFHSINKNKSFQENGYCIYLQMGDWESETISLLWDMCKECEVNRYEKWCLDCKHNKGFLSDYDTTTICSKHNKLVDAGNYCDDFEPNDNE